MKSNWTMHEIKFGRIDMNKMGSSHLELSFQIGRDSQWILITFLAIPIDLAFLTFSGAEWETTVWEKVDEGVIWAN